MKQTAVEWLEEQINLGFYEIGLIDAIQKAKEMEKERMLEFGTKVAMKAHSGQSGWSIIEVYNETFKQ